MAQHASVLALPVALMGMLVAGHCPAETVEPITQLKKLRLDTELTRDGAARAVIHHPPGPGYEAAAQELSQALEQKIGVRLPVKCDDSGRLWREETQHILALGHLGNSLLLRWLRYRSFINPPSSATRRLQTIHDPWGEGRNVVMLGGVDLENVKANFPRLLELLQTPQPGTAVLPRTLDPRPAIPADLKAQAEEHQRTLSNMPLNYPAYHAGWVGQHYLSNGYEELVPLYRDCIRRLSDAKSYVHLYLFRECSGWDVIEDSPMLTDADRRMITNFFRDSIADKKEGIDSDQYFGVRKNVRAIRAGRLIQGNHPSQAACGIMVAADYLRTYYPSELHEEWYREALSFFEPYRTKGSYLGDDEAMQSSSITNILSAVYQTAEDPAEHPFLKCALDRLMPNYNNFGMWPAYGDTTTPYRFGASFYDLGAHIYGSPEYLWMRHFIGSASTTAPAKIPADTPGPSWWPLDAAPQQPAGLVGLQWAEPDETLFSLARTDWVKENQLSVQDLFGRAAFRAGLDPQDDYLLLDGVHLGHAYDDQNGILEYSALGRTFLVSLDYCYGTKQSAHNVVAVSVDGLADAAPSPVAVRRLWADLPSFAATRTVLLTDGRGHFTCPGADWERNILWLKNHLFLVFDRVIARRDGYHSATGFWRMVGERTDLPDGIEMTQQAGDTAVHFRLTVGDVDQFNSGREEDPQASYCFTRYGKQPPPLDNVPPVIHMLKAHKARQLKAGESFSLWTCFRASSPQRATEVACESVQPNLVRVVLNETPMLAALGPVTLDPVRVDAELSLVAADRVCLVAARRLSLHDTTVFECSTPVALEWDLASGECVVQAQGAGTATFLGQTLDLPAGRSTHRVQSGDLGQRLAVALQALPKAPEPPRPRHLPTAVEQVQVVARYEGKSGVECLWAGQLGPAGETVLVGRQDGAVEALGGSALTPLWNYRCDRVVNSIDAGDLDGDGIPEIAVGSDDCHLHALKSDGTALWKWKPPFDELKAKIAYCQWLWPEPFVKKVAVHDINGDGKPEIVAGTGMNTFAVNGTSEELWAFRSGDSHLPCMRALVFLDVNGDGIEEPVGGASDVWYNANLWAVGADGVPLVLSPKGEKAFSGDGWCSGAKVALAEDVLGTGRKSLVFGTRLGGVYCYPDPNDFATRWYRRFGDEIDLLAVLAWQDKTKLIVAAGGDTNWLTAFDPKGAKLWAVYFDAAITAMSADPDQDRLFVGGADGSVHELDATGRTLRSLTLPGTPRVMVAHPAGGVAAGTEQGDVYLLR